MTEPTRSPSKWCQPCNRQPGYPQAQVKAKKNGRIFTGVYHRERKKTRDALRYNESGILQHFDQRLVAQSQVMIEEVPILGSQIADVRAQGDDLAARLQASKCLAQGVLQCTLRRKVFKKVTGEYGIQEVVIERPAGGAILLNQGDILGRVIRRGRI